MKEPKKQEGKKYSVCMLEQIINHRIGQKIRVCMFPQKITPSLLESMQGKQVYMHIMYIHDTSAKTAHKAEKYPLLRVMLR